MCACLKAFLELVPVDQELAAVIILALKAIQDSTDIAARYR
jgi:hypothetical protein